MPRTPKPIDLTAVEQSVSVSLPTELVARLDAAASERVVGRGFLLRYFIEQGMANLPALPNRRVPIACDESGTTYVVQEGLHMFTEFDPAPEPIPHALEPSAGLLEG